MSTNIERRCRQCGCTDHDCHQCIEKTGGPCHWVEQDLCSACVQEKDKSLIVIDCTIRIAKGGNLYQVFFRGSTTEKFTWLVSVHQLKPRKRKIGGYKTYGIPSETNATYFLEEALHEQQSPSEGA